MEDGVFPIGPPLDSAMDMEYMDELLLDGCWLETTSGSEFLNPSTAISGSFDPSTFIWPTPESDGIWNTYQNQISNQDETQKAFFDESRDIASLNHRLWISPRTNLGRPSTSVMGRLVQAVKYIKEFTRGKDSLIQLWVPVNRGGKRVLTTNDQPFEFNQDCLRLANYREISLNYQFSAEEEDSKDLVGLPGRVFLGRVPEWTPDVRFFKSEEYPRVNHAQNFDVRGTLAIPVFEEGSKTCLGVIEVVMTSRMVKLRPELESVCKALEAVNLRSCEVPTVQSVKTCDLSYQAALPEIRNLLRCACETHKLPLAQTWVPCLQQGKSGCRHSNENFIHCVSTVDDACYFSDPTVQEFHEACSEHHLLKGQGVAGKAFLTNQPCFSPDITLYKKTEYPLSHHAMMFGLHGAVAIRLRCIHTGSADFVLEFFLPKNCQNPDEQKKMLNSLSIIILQVSRSLRVVTNQELEEETDSLSSEVIEKEENFSKAENKNIAQKLRAVFEEAQPGTGKQKEVLEYVGEVSVNESAFSSVATSKTGEKRRTKVEKAITLDVLRQYFAGSLKDAAKSIGVCPTTLKRICRQHGIQRWPSRKIKKVGHSLQKIQRVIDSVQGVSGSLPIGSFYTNFPELASPKLCHTNEDEFPSSKLLTDDPKPFALQPRNPQTKSLSSSCSQSSSSSQCCSSETQPIASTFQKSGTEDAVVGDHSMIDAVGVMKRVRSEAELHNSSIEETRMLQRDHHRHQTFPENPNSENLLPGFPGTQSGQGLVQAGDLLRIKVSYGDEKIRFRMQDSWRLADLSREISRRFNMEDVCRYDLKYLDDDNEWVLLTCDADLEECIDVSRTFPSRTIRLLLQVPSHHLPERSSASRSPL